jgi:hypothetical protein
LVFLYCHYDEWDNAALAMMERAADAWEHHSFKDYRNTNSGQRLASSEARIILGMLMRDQKSFRCSMTCSR